MGDHLEALVRERANRRCEYCRFPEAYAELPFQFDHIIARQHGGDKEVENLAFACCVCNRYKGPNLSGVDPKTNEIARLFDPRRQDWDEHVSWSGAVIVGKTAEGRATTQTLNMNRSDTVAIRAWLIQEGVYPL